MADIFMTNFFQFTLYKAKRLCFHVSSVMSFITPTVCRNSVPATASHPSGCRKMVPFLLGRRSSFGALCRLVHLPPRKPCWHCYPCSRPLAGTVAVGKSDRWVGVQLLFSPQGSGVFGNWKNRAPWEGPPSHRQDGPHQYRPTGNQPRR